MTLTAPVPTKPIRRSRAGRSRRERAAWGFIAPAMIANLPVVMDWAQLGHPEVPNDACLQLVMLCSTTSTGTVRGAGKITHG